jgi:hypothetical protein
MVMVGVTVGVTVMTTRFEVSADLVAQGALEFIITQTES